MPDRFSYAAIRDTLQTGDKVLMSGAGHFSQLIKLTTGCKWSHVAMIVRIGDRVCLWESCDKGVDLDDFDQSFIVPAVSTMSRRVHEGAGDIAIRRLIMPADYDRQQMQRQVEAFVAEVNGRPYETDRIELLRAALGRYGNSSESLAAFFCSELVAETDQRIGLLPHDKPSNTYRPRDYSECGNLEYLRGARLGPETLLSDRCI